MPRHWIIATLVILLCATAQGDAQIVTGGFPPPPSLGHELFLVLVGAVLGGFLGPLFQVLDSWIGITPGARQQKANYAVQREIAASLRALAQKADTAEPPPATGGG